AQVQVETRIILRIRQIEIAVHPGVVLRGAIGRQQFCMKLLVHALRERPQGLAVRSEEHTSELQSLTNIVCRLLLEKKKTDLSLTDMETCYKAMRGDLARSRVPRLRADRFGFEPEITPRRARANARIVAVPITCSGR